MEERLVGLTQQLRPGESVQVSTAESDAAPILDSLVTLVDEALQIGDGALLEQCFGSKYADAVVKE